MNKRMIIKSLWLTAILFFLCNSLYAQFLKNSSLYGPIGWSSLPSLWFACNPHSTPDTQPYPEAYMYHLPTDGNSFMSLITRGQRDLPDANYTEAAQNHLMGPLLPQYCYRFSLDLSYSTQFRDGYNTFDNPVVLKVWAGADSCDKAQLLWQSPVIKDTVWTNYGFVFSPEKEMDWIILEADYASLPAYFGNVLIDNLKLEYFKVALGADTTICYGEKVRLNAYLPEATAYRWSNGATTPMATLGGGKHWVEVAAGGCVSTDTIQITELFPIPERLPQDTFLCQQIFIVLEAATPECTYLWSTGSTASSIGVSEPGSYWVERSNGCQTKTETVEVYRVTALKENLPVDTAVCLGETLTLDVSSDYASSLWSTGATEAAINIEQPGTYTVIIDNHCQVVSKEIRVDFQPCCFEEVCCSLTIPNIFTPNADTRNDTFVITATHQPSFYELTVFNRWGDRVYQTHDLNAFWSGYTKGGEASAGLYYYNISTSCLFLNKTVQRNYKGWVQLLRKRH